MDEQKSNLAKMGERPPLKLVPGDPNTITELATQLGKMETIQRHLRSKIQAEKMALMQEHDRKWDDIQHGYARKIHEAVTALEMERDAKLAELKEEYFEKSRNLDKVALRLDD